MYALKASDVQYSSFRNNLFFLTFDVFFELFGNVVGALRYILTNTVGDSILYIHVYIIQIIT